MKYLLFILLKSSSLWALAESHHSINWWRLGSNYKDTPALGWLFLTFFIFIYFLAKTIKKPLSLYLETRSKDIKNQIEESLKVKKESEEKLRLYEQKLASLNFEIEKMKEDFLKQARDEKKELERISLETREKILKDTEDNIKINMLRLKNRLAKEVIEMAINNAQEKLIKNSFDIDSHLKESLLSDIKSDKVKA